MLELEVVGVVAEPSSDAERQRWRELSEASGHPPTLLLGGDAELKRRVVLKERERHRILSFDVGEAEGTAIALGQQRDLTPRPMTHDFVANLLRALDGVSVVQLVITKLEHEAFYAELELSQGDRRVVVDCRPSDGIALAVRMGLPIFAASDLEDAFHAA